MIVLQVFYLLNMMNIAWVRIQDRRFRRLLSLRSLFIQSGSHESN
jgi:hypothetical protein